MRKLFIALVCLVLLVSHSLHCALASAPAVPNQSLSFRTGPNTKYTSLFTLPQSTNLTAIEYEEGNGVTWVLVEFIHNGQVQRAYTGLKRMSVLGSIPWANHKNQEIYIALSGNVLAAPSDYAAHRGWLDRGDSATLLRYEGNYAYIEYYDYSSGAPCRGWIYDWMMDYVTEYEYQYDYNWYDSERSVSATPNQQLSLRTGPNTKYTAMFTMPKSTELKALAYEEGNGVTWVLVEFYKNGERYRGYTGLKRMTVHGDIPWASHYNTPINIFHGSGVVSAPAYDTAYLDVYLEPGSIVTLLDLINEFAYIEFYDSQKGALSRGYISADTFEYLN